MTENESTGDKRRIELAFNEMKRRQPNNSSFCLLCRSSVGTKLFALNYCKGPDKEGCKLTKYLPRSSSTT